MNSRLLLSAVASLLALGLTLHADPAGVTRVPVVFSGGHETDPVDRGRPVYLVAGALGVPKEVFREAFTHVHPAGPDSGGPTHEEARANKAALMSALGKYGVTNDRLDTVSGYYRYVKSHGEMWPTKPASAVALVKDGQVIGYEVTEGGSGYCNPPTISVAGVKSAPAKVVLATNADFAKNGAVTSITVANPGAN
jgi:hypothetical protein